MRIEGERQVVRRLEGQIEANRTVFLDGVVAGVVDHHLAAGDGQRRLLGDLDPEIAKLFSDSELEQIEREENQKAEKEKKSLALKDVRAMARMQNWLEVRHLIGTVGDIRRASRYALALSRWFELAAERARGPGSFAIEMVDAMHNLDRATLISKAKVN